MSKDYTFTSESVSEGHPDKVADQISDAILDAILTQDPTARVACETIINARRCIVFGEISPTPTVNVSVDYEQIARQTIIDIGYNHTDMCFDGNACGFEQDFVPQSKRIAQGVNAKPDEEKEQGAGDQGMVFGYACNETEEYMPMPIYYAHKLVAELARFRKSGEVDFLGPDGKSQVSVKYVEDRPVAINTIVVSTQHLKGTSLEKVREVVRERVIKPVFRDHPELIDNTIYHINPAGEFDEGGPGSDSGLTGRKIIVDTYGGMGRHGGGAFSGKDPSKVDRSAAYMARYIAKNVVAAGLAERCEVQLAYAIGVAEPVSIFVNTFGTATRDEAEIERIIPQIFQLKPAGIIESLGLLRPIYRDTAAYGHFGRPQFPWEATDKAEALKNA